MQTLMTQKCLAAAVSDQLLYIVCILIACIVCFKCLCLKFLTDCIENPQDRFSRDKTGIIKGNIFILFLFLTL